MRRASSATPRPTTPYRTQSSNRHHRRRPNATDGTTSDRRLHAHKKSLSSGGHRVACRTFGGHNFHLRGLRNGLHATRAQKSDYYSNSPNRSRTRRLPTNGFAGRYRSRLPRGLLLTHFRCNGRSLGPARRRRQTRSSTYYAARSRTSRRPSIHFKTGLSRS